MYVSNFGGACLSTTYGGAVPSQDHETLVVSTSSTNCTTFSAVSNGQTTIVTSGNGLTLYSDQNSASAGNGPIYFDSPNYLPAYGTSNQAVDFCLQPDGSFQVVNPSDGATYLQMCGGTVYLNTQADAMINNCTSIALRRTPA